MNDDLIVQRPQGLYCPPGDFYIDPWRKVERAVITHAHADHARPGHAHYLATAVSEGLLRSRLGQGITLQGLAYGEAVEHNGVRISLHPAGHVLGSAQVRVEHAGRVWVASGDYRTTPAGAVPDRTCAPFESVRCDVFITESTFGLPIYRWRADTEIFAEINRWWQDNAEVGRASVLTCYSLGKAQRILAGVDASIGPIVCHGAVEPLNRAYRAAGIPLPATLAVGEVADKAELNRALVFNERLYHSRSHYMLAKGVLDPLPFDWQGVSKPLIGREDHQVHRRQTTLDERRGHQPPHAVAQQNQWGVAPRRLLPRVVNDPTQVGLQTARAQQVSPRAFRAAMALLVISPHRKSPSIQQRRQVGVTPRVLRLNSHVPMRASSASSMRAVSMPGVWATTSRSTCASRSSGRVLRKTPRGALPTAVRVAATM